MKAAQRIAKNASESADEVYDEIDALKSSLKELRTDVVDLMSHAFGIGKGGAHVAKDTATDAVEHLKARLTDLRGRGGQGVAAVEKHISQKPMQSALTAFGVGFIAALLLSRR